MTATVPESARASGPDNEDARRALAAGVAPRKYGALYIVEHRIRALRGYASSAILTSLGNPIVYLFALGVGLASLVPEGIGGVSYLEFVAPALLCAAAMTVAANETTYPIVAGFKWNPIFHGMNASPIQGNQIVQGIMLFIALRMTFAVAVYYAVILAFGAVPSVWGILTVPIAVLTGMAIGLLISSYSATLKDERGQLAMVMRFGFTPMFLFSGTFFPLEQLPIYLQPIGWVSPLWHGVELGRLAAYGHDIAPWLIAVHIGYLVSIVVIGLWSTSRTVTRRLAG
ncbi:ABC transporter permease [Microcella alkaliphila]|uniref:Transport permease protein n=1 Tax=Microcella alkaliphila TaxID=279828 RepID=A0A0U5BQQ5_9MICO|nr:ABC transporter permease [Microcella alkaliphila]BAU33211.1 ABC-2 type transporter [Microcella alkaliphila]